MQCRAFPDVRAALQFNLRIIDTKRRPLLPYRYVDLNENLKAFLGRTPPSSFLEFTFYL